MGMLYCRQRRTDPAPSPHGTILLGDPVSQTPMDNRQQGPTDGPKI
jgi:hypothetical protein